MGTQESLTAADYLRMCFLHGQGCEFGLGKPSTSTPEPSPTPPPTTTTTSTTAATKLPGNQMKQIQTRLRLCFFSNICDGSDNASDRVNISDESDNPDNSEETRASLRQPRIIKSSSFSKNVISNKSDNPSKKAKLSLSEMRKKTIKKLIQERARACLFEGVCN